MGGTCEGWDWIACAKEMVRDECCEEEANAARNETFQFITIIIVIIIPIIIIIIIT